MIAGCGGNSFLASVAEGGKSTGLGGVGGVGGGRTLQGLCTATDGGASGSYARSTWLLVQVILGVLMQRQAVCWT